MKVGWRGGRREWKGVIFKSHSESLWREVTGIFVVLSDLTEGQGWRGRGRGEGEERKRVLTLLPHELGYPCVLLFHVILP